MIQVVDIKDSIHKIGSTPIQHHYKQSQLKLPNYYFDFNLLDNNSILTKWNHVIN